MDLRVSYHKLLWIIFFVLYGHTGNAQTTFQTRVIGQSFETYGASWGDLNSDGYPDLVYSNHRVAPSLYLNNANGTFTDRSNLLDGANPGADMHGVSWADVDNDGDLDLYGTVGGSKAGRPNQQGEYYINNGNRLIKQNGHKLVYGEHRGRVSVWFDANNNGDLDVAMMGYPKPASNNSGESAIFTQNANGSFVKNSGVYNFSCNSTLKFGMLTDLTRNGTLDLVCGGPGFPTKIYQTNTVPFKNRASIVGPKFSSVVDAVSADFDGDQDNDVVLVRRRSKPANAVKVTNKKVNGIAVVNPGAKGSDLRTTGNLNLTFATDFLNKDINFGSNKNHLNLQPDRNLPGKVYTVFLDASNTALHGLGSYNPSNGISASEAGIYIGYFPGAGEWRLRVVSNKWSRFEYSATSTQNITSINHVGYNPQNDNLTPKYLSNNGASGLSDKTNAAGLNVAMTARSAVAADFDNDMDVDLFIICEHEPERCDHYLFSNNGNGKFTRTRIPPSSNGVPESVVTADYDLDGCMDLATANGWFAAVYGASDHLLYRNRCTNGNNAIEFDLVGSQSNRDGTGAIVKVTAAGVTQNREQGNTIHRFSQNFKRLHFGLGSNATANVEIRWPSGVVDTHQNVAAGSLYRANEGGSLQAVQQLSSNASPKLSVSDATVNEADQSVQLTVSLAPVNNTDVVSVDYATHDVSAVAPDDYGSVSGSLNFQPGQSQKNVTVSIVDDADNENNETFDLKLTNAVNATISDNLATITIIDNEGPNTGTECGQPSYSRANDRGLFIWKDCTIPGTETWRVRTTGGGSASLISFEGLVSSNQNFNSVTPIRLESIDALDTSNPKQINYILKMINNGLDGFNFKFNASANVCFDPSVMPSGATVYLGGNRQIMSGAFNLQNLGACQ